MNTYVIGDIQGCYIPLRRLLDKVKFDPAADHLWLTGDLVNRGPESLATLEFLYSIRNSVTSVLGNHDLHLLAVAFTSKSAKKKDTLGDILASPDSDILLNWMRHLPLLHYDEPRKLALVHAGIPPQWDIETALSLAHEVEQQLQGKDYKILLENIYGNTPDLWDEKISGYSRWRLIVNYFTRMRVCDPAGKLELTFKDEPALSPKGYSPWYVYPEHKCRNIRILFGHWAALDSHTGIDSCIALDSGCVWGNRMTLYHIEKNKFYFFKCN